MNAAAQRDNLAALVARMEAKTSKPLPLRRFGFIPTSPPEPAQRVCPTCRRHVTLNPDWTCPTPDCVGPGGKPTRVIYSVGRTDCPGCGRPRGFMFRGNQRRLLNCLCEQTEAERRAEERRRAREKANEIRRAEEITLAKQSRGCWVQMACECKIGEDRLFPYCYTCQRFGSKYQAKLKQFEREERANQR